MKEIEISIPEDLSAHEVEVFKRAVTAIAIAYKERTISIEDHEKCIKVVAEFSSGGSSSMKQAHALLEHRHA
ncbi:hypothetical protein [Pseudomonas delhiensis]|uniref:hypothetical protein n=1 Tax=Pseudomonas delhiensis TaxID=366289 RepID=UPI001113CD98|nr:hypothetical protein [Pseudomonas delhiensis]